MRLIPKSRIVIQRKIAWLLIFLIVTLFIVGFLIYAQNRNLGKTSSQISRTYEVISTLQGIDLLTAESGDASYRFLQSGDPSAARQIKTFHRQLGQSLDTLHRLINDNSDQDGNIDRLAGLINDKIRSEDNLNSSFFNAATHIPVTPGSPAPINAVATNAAPALESRLAAADSTLQALLVRMTVAERIILAERKEINEAGNRRTAWLALVLRIAGSIFFIFILIKINSDISRRKRVQEQLEAAIREAREAKQLQEQFLANMSHEIRTPMNGIKGMTDLLLSTNLSTKQYELAEVIKRSVNNLLVIVGDILDFSKIKAGKLNIEKITFNLSDVLDNATAIFEHRLKKKRLELFTSIDPTVPQWLIGDPHRLNQVLINLLGNAIKFTDQGHIRVDVTLRQQTASDVILAFSVKDTGIGIPEASLPQIFDSFAQGSRNTSRLYGGTGLGLTICKQLLQLQGGDISVTSAIGKGATFQFNLPFGVSAAADDDRSAADTTQDYSKLLAGKRFLVAEDNEINQKLIDYVLRKAGGEVEIFNNGADAIRHLQQDRVFDLIIMDIQMPEMDGYATTRYIRNDLKLQTPIIAMTATAMKGEQLQCIESGMNEYMTKPFEFTELYKRIGTLLAS
ncbi:MAG TPA: ATP-binding protein [Puia sp.]|jgi:signal transduction histidine kinase|nr:ATP-binding protein [Puia sp.]